MMFQKRSGLLVTKPVNKFDFYCKLCGFVEEKYIKNTISQKGNIESSSLYERKIRLKN